MCQFCVKHGDGKAWYLQASTYAYDLDSDLKRADYLVDFLTGFPKDRDWALTNLTVIMATPPSERDDGAGFAGRG